MIYPKVVYEPKLLDFKTLKFLKIQKTVVIFFSHH